MATSCCCAPASPPVKRKQGDYCRQLLALPAPLVFIKCTITAAVPNAAQMGIQENLVRFSCGIESVEDIWADFEQALAKCAG